MDENTEHHARPVGGFRATRASTCSCCGRRDVRQLIHLVNAAGRPAAVAVCPHCDRRPAELQGWLSDIVPD
ncbi:hypothetical protein WIS52_00740 [Pseudonocardia nematodicida]|uniref:Uncharacterized protein n=1 Tax=Pseudonocardia nematodicida TaxID=1206997 RepID=A0ABV1K3E2_9PSEU